MANTGKCAVTKGNKLASFGMYCESENLVYLAIAELICDGKIGRERAGFSSK